MVLWHKGMTQAGETLLCVCVWGGGGGRPPQEVADLPSWILAPMHLHLAVRGLCRQARELGCRLCRMLFIFIAILGPLCTNITQVSVSIANMCWQEQLQCLKGFPHIPF